MCWISGFGRRTRWPCGAAVLGRAWHSHTGSLREASRSSSRAGLRVPPLSLKGLRPGALYDLEVVLECPGGAEQGATAVLQFTTEEVPGDAPKNSRARSSGTTSERSAGPTTERLGLQGRLADHRMFLVVPWTIPSPLKDPAAESRVLLEGVIKRQDVVLAETGMFSRCQTGDVSGAVSKPFLLRHFGGNVTAVLNDGRCSLQETDKLYYYRMTSAPSLCGGETLLNQTHVSLRNTMTVTLSSGSSITQRDLKVLWTCAYPLLHTSTAHTQPGLAWFSSHSVVQASSSRLLQLSMGLYSDASYASSHAYAGPVELPLSARLHIQVTLHSQDSLAFQMSLQLEATETTDPLEERRAFYLKEG
ncbi:uncharacterized protein LOC133119302 [Conger conger]|uniref:uncharacterized protein LOC133119302 n=1 Tax=Conger conger TaxID=82655 RepID=UPI002A5A968F|nr:uncharacterized protein LOC133119302 [Conger conger]